MIKMFFVALILLTASSWAATPTCSSILSVDRTSRESAIEDLVQRVLTNSDQSEILGALNGSAQLKWQSYKWVEDLKTAIGTHALTVDDFKILIPEILNSSRLFSEHPEKEKVVDLNYHFYEQLIVVNSMLGARLFPDVYLRYVEKDQALILNAQQIVKSNEDKLRKIYSTSRYLNTVDFVSAIEKYSTKGENLLELINDGLIVTIRRPEGARFWIPITGFQNQRVTGKSKGTYNPSFRNTVESSLIGMASEDYQKLSVRLQPQYGEVRPDFRTSSLDLISSSNHYGPDLWIVKKGVIEKRSTWTPNDSFAQIQPSEQPKAWNQMFLPWSHRELMAPFLITSVVRDSFFAAPKPVDFVIDNSHGGSHYIEAQIWGPVSLQDIEAFVFTLNEPDAAFVKQLRSFGIKIFDGRSKFIKPFEVTYD